MVGVYMGRTFRWDRLAMVFYVPTIAVIGYLILGSIGYGISRLLPGWYIDPDGLNAHRPASIVDPWALPGALVLLLALFLVLVLFYYLIIPGLKDIYEWFTEPKE
jgi:hypothetical protein